MARIRLTRPTQEVLTCLLRAESGQAAWGNQICEATRLGSGTVYPILSRLVQRGLVIRTREAAPHPGRPARYYFELTPGGQKVAESALARLGAN